MVAKAEGSAGGTDWGFGVSDAKYYIQNGPWVGTYSLHQHVKYLKGHSG